VADFPEINRQTFPLDRGQADESPPWNACATAAVLMLRGLPRDKY
jgi:hypothetical protein